MNTAEVRELEHVLQNLGWTELFAYLCPGAITLLSIALWIEPDLGSIFGKELSKNEFVTAIVFLLISYAVGLLVASASEAGTNRTLLIKYGLQSGYKPRRFWRFVWLFFFWVPSWRHTADSVRKRIRIQDALEVSGIYGTSQTFNNWTSLATYRIMVAEQLHKPATLILREAESVHRRRLFALGVASAFMLLAIEAALRLLLGLLPEFVPDWTLSCDVARLPKAPMPILWAITILGLLVSFGLRVVGGRLWEYEFLLTCSEPLRVDLTPEPETEMRRKTWRDVAAAVADVLKEPHDRA